MAKINPDKYEIIKCKACAKEVSVLKSAKRDFCCRKCFDQFKTGQKRNVPKIEKADLNRPYTNETAKIIRMWHKNGDSLENIAIALGRSLENVKMAFD